MAQPLTVSVDQAAATALMAWLAGQMAGVQVNDVWPDPGIGFPPGGAITCLRVGAPDPTPLLPVQVVKQTDDPTGPLSTVVFRTHTLAQAMQLDVWATSVAKRDDLNQRLGDALTAGPALSLSAAFLASVGTTTNQDPVRPCLLLQLAPPWDHLVASFTFDEPEAFDTPLANKRSEHRATYHGHAYFDRTVTRRVPRMLRVKLPIAATPTAGTSVGTVTLTVSRTAQGTLTRTITRP